MILVSLSTFVAFCCGCSNLLSALFTHCIYCKIHAEYILYTVTQGTKLHNRHLIVHSEKETNWLRIQRKSQIGCKFRERAELSVHLKKVSNYLSILRQSSFVNKLSPFLSQFNSFSTLTANSTLSPNLQSIQLVLLMYY